MSALNQISGNAFSGTTTINTDLTIEGNLDVNGSIDIGNVTLGNTYIEGDLVIVGSVLEQTTASNFLTMTITNGTLLNSTISNLKSTNITSDNILLASFTCSNALITNLSSSNAILTNSRITNQTSSNLLNTNLTSSNSVLINALNTNLTSSNAIITNLSSSNAVITNQTSTNVLNTNLTSSNAVITNLTNINATMSNLTSVSNVNFANRKILINGSGANLTSNDFTVGSLVISANNDITSATKSGLYLSPIEFDATKTYSNVLNYNSVTKEVTYKPYVYGSFISTSDQSLNQTTSNLILLDSSNVASGITLNSNKATVSQRGIYNIGVRVHIQQSGGSNATCNVWLKKNGNNLDNSAVEIFVPGNNTENLGYYEFMTQLEKDDYIEVYAYSSSNNLSIVHHAAVGDVPAINGICLTLYQVS